MCRIGQRPCRLSLIDLLLNTIMRDGFDLEVAPIVLRLNSVQGLLDLAWPGVVAFDQVAVVGVHDPDGAAQLGCRFRMESPAKSFGPSDNLKRKVQQLAIGMLDARRLDAGGASSTVTLADIQFSYSPYIYGIFVDLPSSLADLLADLLHIWITTSFITEVAIDHTVGYGPIIELGTIITSVSQGGHAEGSYPVPTCTLPACILQKNEIQSGDGPSGTSTVG